MIGVVVGLVLAQSVAAQHKQLDASLSAGRFAEAEQRARKLLSSSSRGYPAELSRLTRALAEQGKCSATRATLTSSVRDRFLSAQLDTAAGNFEAARVTLSSAVDELSKSADPSLASALELLELLEHLAGNAERAAALDARGLELREKELSPEPFDGAVGTLNFALEQKDPTRALKALTEALASLEKSAGPQHALVRVALERRASLLESQGKADAGTGDRERAAAVAKAGWCR